MERYLRIACWILIATILGYGLSFTLAFSFVCKPVSFFWDRSIEGGRCLSQMVMWIIFSTLNMVTDMAIFAMPIRTFWRLKIPMRQKIALIFVFAFGGV